MRLTTRNNDDRLQTLFGDSEVRFSGFGGPMMNFSSIGSNFAHYMGGGGGVIINNVFFGGFGYGLTNPIELSDGASELNFGYGGLWLGVSAMGNEAVHPALNLKVGWAV
ncbi:MAG: hypothetical protein HC896_02725 [Bacteroidales bacterium]|nr:hypothetical protein [Bacteroidales bacterium]